MKIIHKIRSKYKTQREMAESLGLSQATVSDWLKGKKPISPENINLIANSEGIRPGELFEEIYPSRLMRPNR